VETKNKKEKGGTKMKKLILWSIVFATILTLVHSNAFSHDTDLYIASGQGVEANILIMFDNSGSMNQEIQAYFYKPGTTYTGPADKNGVYAKNFRGQWVELYTSIDQVPCISSRTILVNQGHYEGPTSSNCSQQSKALRTGDYINYLASIGGDETIPKLTIAKKVITDFLTTVNNVRVGVMIFNDAINVHGDSDSEGGHIQSMMTSLTTDTRNQLVKDVNAIQAVTWTPLAETLYETSLYFKGGPSYFNPPQVYVSPIQVSCQKNYVIIITDGESTKDHNPILASAIGDFDKDSKEPGNIVDGGTHYLDDVAKYLYDTDLRSDMENKQNIQTYTIGFTIHSDLLERTARNGNGKYYYAENVQTLADAFQNVIDEILTKTSSFVAPIVPVSRMERELSGDKVYLALFKPLTDRMWSGNIKKYNISSDGTVLDVNLNPALDSSGTFIELSQSFWSLTPDGNNVERGGVGEVLLSRSGARNIYTYMGMTPDLTNTANQFSLSNSLITPVTLGFLAGENQNRDDLIRFVQGFDPYNGHPTTKRDWILGSFLHSKPVVVHYPTQSSLIFAGSNDGMLHAFDDNSGDEVWAFIPTSLLGSLQILRTDQVQSFADGSARVFLGNNQKILIFGLRRGGNRYIALDITDRTSPRFLWEISPSTPGFSELGQTWSSPCITKIKYGTDEKWVFIVGAGYDENEDNDTITSPDSKGRGIYVVDVVTGSLVWKYTIAENPSMIYSIPADVTKVDSDGDGKTDRIYVGDMGGKLWRIDLSTSGLTGRIIFDCGRKMFYSPDVTLESDAGIYEMLFFGTGDREHPKEPAVLNRLYAVKDKNLNGTLTEADLVDVTADRIQVGSDAEKAAITAQLKNGNGWYIKLDQNPGEKSLSQPLVFSKTAYFTTFSPTSGSQGDPCFVGEGVARMYMVDYKNGSSIFDADANLTLDRSDRSKLVGTSIPSSVVIALRNDGIASAYIGVGGGIISPPLKNNKTVVPVSWRKIF
jgi:type IV pilus assembly protein PilY1